ncbi:unnamed protein product [Phytomonas sp. EM1]|nr:unnamed protein product [Phytomonas sp. EM1]|eukprot:CCW59785.1 unnamed protein product [Phytomonas sp. isolate EM1]
MIFSPNAAVSEGRSSDEKLPEVIDLKFTRCRLQIPPLNVEGRSQWRPSRRDRKRTMDKQQYKELLKSKYKNSNASSGSDFHFISGLKYVFQSFIRQYPVGALVVWVILFLVELSLVGLSIAQPNFKSTSFMHYDRYEKSKFFYARFILSIISLLQLLFAYSLSISTIFVVISTSIYQILVGLVALCTSWTSASRMYVPLFLRCWPMRQYLLFILDSISSMTTRNRKLDLVQIAADSLTLFICMVFTASSVFRCVESFNGYYVSFADAVYFTVVTVTTVGFGDVHPQTALGKGVVIVIIILFLSKMPTFIHVIRSTIKLLRLYRTYKGRLNHFIVYGLVTREEAISILDEVFCLYPMKAVCFCNREFSEDVLSIGRHPSYRMRTTFLIIDTLDIFAFRRMKANKACAVFILPVKAGYSSRVDDDVMLTSLTFEQSAPNLPQYHWFCYGLHAKLLCGKHISIINEYMQKNIMATAMLLPGIVPFLVNLVRNAGAEGKEPPELWTGNGVTDWKSQYEYSRRNVISTFPVPSCFIGWKLENIVRIFKRHDVLIVGVVESDREVMHLNLDYRMTNNDALAAIYESLRNSMAVALELFNRFDSTEKMPEHNENEPLHGSVDDGEVRLNVNESFRVDTCNASFSTPWGYPNERHREKVRKGDLGSGSPRVSKEDLKLRLEKLECVPKMMCGIPLSSLQLGPQDARHLDILMKRYEDALSRSYGNEEERTGILNDAERQLNAYLKDLAHEHASAIADFTVDTQQEVVFLFIDQASSIQRKTSISVYEDIISQTIAQYGLYVMMQCIRSVHPYSKLRLLTLRKYPPEYLKMWESIFNAPLCCIQGQGILNHHLYFSLLGGSNKPQRIHGILLYCSQMGPRDFGDIPLSSVMNDVLGFLEMNAQRSGGREEIPEQNIMIELQSFLSSIKIAPFHVDYEWRRRGERNFQDSLAFMLGRCFSSNMLHTLLIHSYREHRINTFFNMVLNLTLTVDIFNPSMWISQEPLTQTLFRLCGNRSLQCETFGAAFEFLLTNRRCIAIGVFRLFPSDEYLKINARYFVTNPPLSMPLFIHDIIYCLDCKTGVVASC